MTESYRKLIAWQKAKDLALDIYRCTRKFPKDETYGLTSQMRRAAVSVPSNIAEGKGRRSRKDFAHFLYQARGHYSNWRPSSLLREISNTLIALTFNNTRAKRRRWGEF